jgi:hypothetical protein
MQLNLIIPAKTNKQSAIANRSNRGKRVLNTITNDLTHVSVPAEDQICP